ncbi:MAG: hypothetical protein JJ879_04085 [Sneathiella sp.]|nr:hypothetical protein [Sneathiella sp.]
MKTSLPTNSDAEVALDWVLRLHRAMAEMQLLYDAQIEVVQKRKISRETLAMMITFLIELPVFKDEMVHFPLKDLVQALADLDRGRAPELLKPSNFGGTNISKNATSELKFWVRAVFNILCESEFKTKEACIRIADGLTKNGRSARNGKPINWRMVQRWCREDETSEYIPLREKIEQFWADFCDETNKIEIVDSNGEPISKKEIAGRFADMCWTFPNLRDQ